MALVTPRDVAAVVGAGTNVTSTKVPPAAAEIDALARRVGVKFPADYRAFLAGCGSLLVEIDPARWPRDGAADWQQTRFELAVFGVSAETEWLRLDVEARRFRAEDCDLDEGLVPVFAFANTSDRVCFDETGALFEWSRGDISPVRESFDAVLGRLLAEQRRYKDQLAAR